MEAPSRKEMLRSAIDTRVFATHADRPIVSPSGMPMKWIFDFRKIMLRGEMLETITALAWSEIKSLAPFQVGGMETASLPLITALVLKGRESGHDINGFYIRKSRDKDGLQNNIEGDLNSQPVVLVDDILNSGQSILKQINILEKEGLHVKAVFVILRFRARAYYAELEQRGVRILSLFELSDFPTARLEDTPPRALHDRLVFEVVWRSTGKDANFFHVLPKSGPAVDGERVYMGDDRGRMRAFCKASGETLWEFKTLLGEGAKRIFSSPAIENDMLFFGAYDGNVYALNVQDGRARWVYRDADWVGSSPCVSPRQQTVFIGLEFGLWSKRGGIAALDARTGKLRWSYRIPSLVHASPAVSDSLGVVICGSNSGDVYCLDTSTGKLIWKYSVGSEVKASCVFDDSRSLVFFGCFDGYVHVVDVRTGTLVRTLETLGPIFSTPALDHDRLFVGSTDKNVYSFHVDTGKIAWKFRTRGRVFSSPHVAGQSVFVGSNDGIMYELDKDTGKELGIFPATERIVNKIAHDPASGLLYVPTHANDLYCLRRRQPNTIE